MSPTCHCQAAFNGKLKKLFSPKKGVADGIRETLETIDFGGHWYGPYALGVPESAGSFVDIAGYIRAELGHVAPVQVSCGVLLHPQAARSAELMQRPPGRR